MIRILQVVYRMALGGIETTLVHTLRHLDRGEFRVDFLVHTAEPQVYDEEIRSLGCRIIPCLGVTRPWVYARNFGRILREQGPYDIVHCHVELFEGFVMWLAARNGVPVRIAHSHNRPSELRARAGWLRRLFAYFTDPWVVRYATAGLAVSGDAAAGLYGPDWESDPRWSILHPARDFSPFRAEVSPVEVRAELGLSPDAFVLGHVGRLDEQKNHQFILAIASELARREPRTSLLLVGDGALRPAIEQEAARRGLDGRVVFAGPRDDVPRLLRGAMDVFVFPSLFEGLPMALVEAQAAGLPCVVSDVVTREAEVVEPLITRLSLAQPASDWAEAILAARDARPSLSRLEALAQVERSSFGIGYRVRKITEVYCEQVARRARPAPAAE